MWLLSGTWQIELRHKAWGQALRVSSLCGVEDKPGVVARRSCDTRLEDHSVSGSCTGKI